MENSESKFIQPPTLDKKKESQETPQAEVVKQETKEAKKLKQEAEPSDKEKIRNYLKKHLPISEVRIQEPMRLSCKVSVVIPSYRERENILQALSSLVEQADVTADDFEVLVVVNNTEGVSDEVLRNNQETIKILRGIGSEIKPTSLQADEEELLEKIRKSGIHIFCIDKSTPEAAFLSEEAGVGAARDRGVAEAVERFLSLDKDGIIAQSDADVLFDKNYIKSLINVFKHREDLVGIVGRIIFRDNHENPDKEKATLYAELDNSYSKLIELYQKFGAEIPHQYKDIAFVGANMASRAFAAAKVDGVPKMQGGECIAFGENLARIGKVDFMSDVVTMPERRISDRIRHETGHGQKIKQYAAILEKKEEIKVKPIEWTTENDRINRLLEGAIRDHRIDPSELNGILQIRGRPIFTLQEILTLSQALSTKDDFSDIREDALLIAYREKFTRILGEFFPPIPIIDAVNKLVDLFLKNEELKAMFDAKFHPDAHLQSSERLKSVLERVSILLEILGAVQ